MLIASLEVLSSTSTTVIPAANMASFLNSVRQGFGRPSNKGSGGQKSGSSPSPSPTYQSGSSLAAPRVPPLPNSPSLSSTLSTNEGYHAENNPPQASATPLFMRDGMQIFIVKGNYMTLAAKPKSVELGEWLAHHGKFKQISIIVLPSRVTTSHNHLSRLLAPSSVAERSHDKLCSSGNDSHILLSCFRASTTWMKLMVWTVVEQFRLLSQFITVVQSTSRKGGQVALICNPLECPTMSAGTSVYP